MSIKDVITKASEKYRAKHRIHTKSKTKWYLRWSTYFILSTIAFIGLFALSEKEIEMKQPSDNWSMGVEILAGLPTDYRLIDQVKLPDGSGFVVAYVDDLGVHLHEFDWYGKAIADNLIEMNTSTLKLIEITSESDQLYLYHTDRVTLQRVSIEPKSLIIGEAIEISKHSEQFAAEGLNVIAGDDTTTQVFKDKTVLAQYSSYENLKKVCIASQGDKIIMTLNTADGGKILTYDNNQLIVSDLYDQAEQKTYGYIKDIHLENGILTLVSSVFNHLAPGSPTVLGVWQLEDSTYKPLSFKLFYHVRTSLDPVITKVDGKKVSYILGTQQTVDTVNKGLSKYPQTKGGLFTNVSLFTREDDILVENTRLTLTRKYPIGYQTFDAPFGSVLTWADKVEGKATIMMAGQGEDWISHARSQFDVNYMELVSAALMAIGNTMFFGVISLLISLQPFYGAILGAVILSILYRKFAPFDREKKGNHILGAMILLVVVIQMILVASPASDFRFYSQIYPWLFGSTFSLAAISTIISGLALWIYFLWRRQHHYYTNRLLHFSVFFGVEIYLFMIGIMSFFVSAMMKNNFKM